MSRRTLGSCLVLSATGSSSTLLARTLLAGTLLAGTLLARRGERVEDRRRLYRPKFLNW